MAEQTSPNDANDDTTQTASAPRNLLKAALYGLAIWAMAFTATVGYFAASNLQTKKYYRMQNMGGKKGKRQARKAHKDTPQVSKLLKHQDAIDDLIEDMENLEKSHAVKMEFLKEKMVLLQDLQKTVDDSLQVAYNLEKPGDAVAPKVAHVEKVLTTSSISSLSNIQADVGMAIQELEAIIESIANATNESTQTIDFAALDQLLKQEFPERDPSVSNISCGSKKKITKPKSKIPDDAARKSHLDAMVTMLDEILDQRSKDDGKFYPMDGKTLQTSSLQTVRRYLNSKTKSITSEIVKVAEGASSKDSDENDNCLDEDIVLDLLEGALDAITQNIDLRNHLRRRAMELDPTAKSIILDADLPEVRPFVPEPATLQLSRILDKPLLFEVIEWIDKLVEAVGGYNDSLDTYLDMVAGSSRASIGELVVEEILKKADGVEIPNPKLTIEKYSKKILKS